MVSDCTDDCHGDDKHGIVMTVLFQGQVIYFKEEFTSFELLALEWWSCNS